MKPRTADVGHAVALLASACGSSTAGSEFSASSAPASAAPGEESVAASTAASADRSKCCSGEAFTLKWQNWSSQEEASKAFSDAAVAAFQAKNFQDLGTELGKVFRSWGPPSRRMAGPTLSPTHRRKSLEQLSRGSIP